MSIQLARVNRALNNAAGTPWPETFTEKQIAYFATWRSDNEPSPDWSARAAPVFDALRLGCQRGELEHTTTTERVPDPNWRGRPRMVLKTGIQTSETARQRIHPSNTRPQHPPTIEVIRYNIAAAPVARWLEAQDVQPGELLQAWFASQGVGVAAVEVAPPAPAVESAEARGDRRLRMCVDAGLPMGKAAIRRLPDGVGDIAEREGVRRQTFSADVKKALRRKYPETRPSLRAV